MKNDLLKWHIGGKFRKNENLKKKVDKIIKTHENKRDFLPLFTLGSPRVLSEKEIKSQLFNVAKKYFEIKEEIDGEREIS